MEINVFLDNRSRTSIPFHHNVKLIDYWEFYLIIVTTNNEIYSLKKTDLVLEKLNNPSLCSPLKYLICNENQFLVVNDLNEFYSKNIYNNSSTMDENYPFNKLDKKFKEKIKFIRSGRNYYIVVTKDNSIYGFGSNTSGQLGTHFSEDDKDNQFKKIDFKNLKDLQCGNDHTILLDIFGNIYTTGSNYYGQLGFSNVISGVDEFKKIELPFKVKQIYADNYISFIVNEFNELFSVGYNVEGQLGTGSIDDVKEFTKVVIDDCKNYNFYLSHNQCSFISDENNNIYISGGRRDHTFVHQCFKISFPVTDGDYLCKFTKVDCFRLFGKSKKYIQVIPLEGTIVVVLSDYKINCLDDKEENIKFNYLQRVKNKQFIDINICCED